MPADPEDPQPVPGSRLAHDCGWEDQDEILAWEQAAFPAEEPLWELECLEYLDSGGPADGGPWPPDVPSLVQTDQAPGDYPALRAPGDSR